MSITRAQVRAAVARYPRGITTRKLADDLRAPAYRVGACLSQLADGGLIAREAMNGRDNLWKPMEARP